MTAPEARPARMRHPTLWTVEAVRWEYREDTEEGPSVQLGEGLDAVEVPDRALAIAIAHHLFDKHAEKAVGSLMAESSGCFESGLEGCSRMEDGPEDVDTPAGQGDDGLMMVFSLAPFSIVEDAAVIMAEGAESGLVEDTLEALVAAAGPTQETGASGLAQDGRHASGGGERVGGAEAREIACLGDELRREDDPHAGQAADEGRVRVAFEQRLQLAIEIEETDTVYKRFGGEFSDQPRGHALGRHGDGLLGRGGQGAIDQCLDMGQPPGGLQMAHKALLAGGAQLGRGDVAGQEVQRPLGLEVEAGFQARKDAHQQVVHAGQALGLGIDQVAAPADEQPDLEIEFARRIDRPQVGAGADLVGDGACVTRIGLVLAAGGALAGAVDGQARDVNERQPCCGQHGFGKAGDATNDIEADAYGAAKADELFDQRRDVRRRVRQLAIEANQAVGIDGGDPMRLLGDIDPNTDRHGAPRQLRIRRPARAVVALHSDRSQSPISGRGGVAVPGDLPPEPSWAASMKTIPAPPPHHDPGMPGSWCQALPKQQLNGRAA